MKASLIMTILLASITMTLDCYAAKSVDINANFDSWGKSFDPQVWIYFSEKGKKTIIEPKVGEVAVRKEFPFKLLENGGYIKFQINKNTIINNKITKYTQNGTCSIPIKTYSGTKALKTITLVFKRISNSPDPTHFFQCELEQEY
jgi:hypothetical protein